MVEGDRYLTGILENKCLQLSEGPLKGASFVSLKLKEDNSGEKFM